MTAAVPADAGPAIEETILATATLLMEPGAVAELRILKTRWGTLSGYFNDPAMLARAAAELDRTGRFRAIYVTMNPCDETLLARAVNRVEYRAEVTTGDRDILRRRLLLIDLDPDRKVGISSTDREHGRAIATACAIWDDLRSEGWPDPIVCDSGNGAHLLYRIDLPNTPEAAQRVKATLAAIARHSAPDDVKVDLTMFNAARITKLYGTMVRKGDSTPERPHRRSKILEVPDELKVINL